MKKYCRYSKPLSNAGDIYPSKATHSVNLHWMNLTLFGINKDMETWLWKAKVNKQSDKNTVCVCVNKLHNILKVSSEN
jgi:hypothetical protein